MMKWLTISILALLSWSSFARADYGGQPDDGKNFLVAAGIVNHTTIGRTPPGAAGPMQLYCPDETVVAGNVGVYVIWYSDPGHPWTVQTKNIIRGFITSLATSTYWTNFQQYGNSCMPPVQYATGFTLLGECDDPENEGASFTCGNLSTLTAVINANLTPNGCALPSESNLTTVYLVLPSSINIVCTDCGGCHATVDGVNAAMAIQGTSNDAGPTHYCPLGLSSIYNDITGFPGVDCQVTILTHEIIDMITDAEGQAGWSTQPGDFHTNLNEVAEVCEGQSSLAGYTTAVDGGAATWSTVYDGGAEGGGAYSYASDTAWQLSGVCSAFYVPPISNTCRTSADCVQTQNWVNSCRNFQCTIPTCEDGLLDGDESDVDCGGSCMEYENAPSSATSVVGFCRTNRKCRSPNDCASGICTSGVCN